MAYLNGRNLVLFNVVNNQYVAVATCASCTLQITNEVVETLPSTDFTWRDYAVGKKSWSISATGLIDLDNYDLTSLLNKKISIAVLSVADHDDDDPEYESDMRYIRRGTAIVTSIEEASETQGKASWQISLQGVGALTMANNKPKKWVS